ncbi:MAG: class I SAM-dependent methyltransferase [Fimbriimonas sp.]
MAQNIYDQAEFFEGYRQLPRSLEGLDAAAEWPSMRARLPELNGLRVVDLGCGFGWFCRWAREQGADEVLGLDVSQNMLDRAAETTSDSAIAYRREDLESVELPEAAFDLAYSSLALHYIENLPRLLETVFRSLVPGGHFVLSVEHPIFTAPDRPGWVVDAEGRRIWPLNRYQYEGSRATDWLTKGVIKQHRTLGTYVNLLLRQGFVLRHLEEWSPTDAQLASRPDWAEERDRPTFLLLAAMRP